MLPCCLYTSCYDSGPNASQSIAKSTIRRMPTQIGSGPGGGSLARLLYPPRQAISVMISPSRGGFFGSFCLSTTRQVAFHSLSVNSAVHGTAGPSNVWEAALASARPGHHTPQGILPKRLATTAIRPLRNGWPPPAYLIATLRGLRTKGVPRWGPLRSSLLSSAIRAVRSTLIRLECDSPPEVLRGALRGTAL